MGAVTSIVLGTLAAASAASATAGAIEGRKARKSQEKEVARQKVELAAQQAEEKRKIKAQEQLAQRKKGAVENLEAAKMKQEKRKKSSGREGTILTDALKAAGTEAAGTGSGLASTLGGGGKTGQKDLLGL